MKTYKVKVNGKLYEVELESVTESAGKIEAPKAEEKKEAAPAPKASADGDKVLAPIGGKLLSLSVKVGDQVKKGQVVAVIEAMKLENEVPSPFEGTVKEVVAAKGNNVANGDVLVILG